MTYYLDELKPGDGESLSRTVTERDIQAFGEATGDMNPVHFNEAYAAKTVFRGRIAHGALSIGFLSALMGMQIPGPGTIFVSMNIRFVSPVRIGDTVVAAVTFREMLGKRQAAFDVSCKVGEAVVLEGEVVVMPPRRPKGQTNQDA